LAGRTVSAARAGHGPNPATVLTPANAMTINIHVTWRGLRPPAARCNQNCPLRSIRSPAPATPCIERWGQPTLRQPPPSAASSCLIRC